MEIYVVQNGDTLWEIAGQFQVSVEQIVDANELADANALAVGMALVIPTPEQQHTVQPGENLWQIAARYQVSVQSIIEANNIQNPGMIFPGTQLTIPKIKPVIDVNAYTLNPGETGANEIREVGPYLTYCMPFTYSMNEDGTLNEFDDRAILQAAQEERVVPILCLTNFSATETGSQLAHAILSNPAAQETLLTNLLAVMREKDYAGINIDFENVLPEDRENYNQFLQRTADRFHPEGFIVSTAVAPKVSGEQQGLLYEAHDYEAHGRIADFVILMTYEWGYRFGPPQAISPINQIKRVLDYAVTVIPRDKIFFGFQIYARDWRIPHVEGQEAETFSQQEAVRRAIEFGAAIQYDETSQSPFFRYTDNEGQQHEVWFEDARSAQAKFDLVKEYNLRGISYWVLGYPFPQNWLLLEDNFVIRKRI